MQQLKVTREFEIGPGCVVKGSYGGNFDHNGRTYYVNNITGTATNDGLSWNNPMIEFSTAVTASEAYRQLQGTNTNDYIRNRIVLQGTGTAYTGVTALPMYCDVIGLGADPRGNGAGIVRIGPTTGAGSGVLLSASHRGMYFENIQFQAGTDGYAFKGTNLFRSVFYNCAFMGNDDAANPATGYEMAITSGLLMKDCHFGTALHDFMVSMDITGAYFHNAIVDNCTLHGQTAGFRIVGGCTQTQGSKVKNCVIASGRETCLIGVDDNMTGGDIPHLVYVNNAVNASEDATIVNDHTARWIANYAANGFSTSTNS